MIFNRVENVNCYQSIVDQYKTKHVVSNDYLQRDAEILIVNGNLFECCEDGNAYFLVKKSIGHRLYYYINDFNAIPDFSDLQDVVIEILYRGVQFYPHNEIDFFEKAGFKINLVRDQYSGIYKDLLPSSINISVELRSAISIEEVAFACDLFNESFDSLSGDYIPIEEYPILFQNKSVLVAVDRGNNLLGALHQSFSGKVACISHVAVLSKARGCHVGQSLLDKFVDSNMETEKSRYMLWVQQQNTAAVSMYQKKGFKYAGKSTLSLIK